jgi:two-component sensor histidine kinase
VIPTAILILGGNLETKPMLKVLIAEDDIVMADLLEEVIIDGGFAVCGIAHNVKEGLALAQLHKPDIVLLDLRLAQDELGTDIAAGLDRSTGLGILYATANSHRFVLTRDDGDACLDKPFRPADVIRGLQLVHEITSRGKASKTFPSGFRFLEGSGKMPSRYRNGKDCCDITIARRHGQPAALSAFASFARGESDLGNLLTEAARVCVESLDVEFCIVCRYRSDQNDLLVEAGVGWRARSVGDIVASSDKNPPQGRAFVTGAPARRPALSEDARFLAPAFYTEHGIVSTLDVVIEKKDGQPWGILEVANPEPRGYDAHDIKFVNCIADVVAEAVNTSKRTGMVQDALNQMKDMVAERDRLLADKVALAQELQRRVRNNLRLVYGMLDKQITAPGDTAELRGLRSISQRVITLSKVYDHLLETELTRRVDFGGYLKSLCDGFGDMETEQHQGVDLTCRAASLMLDLDTATALGLIVAELLSNSFRHVFPGDRGKISVSLTLENAGNDARIEYADDGVAGRDSRKSRRCGLGLVKRLMEQVEGSAEIHSDIGTTWGLTFPAPRAMGGNAAIPRQAAW